MSKVVVVLVVLSSMASPYPFLNQDEALDDVWIKPLPNYKTKTLSEPSSVTSRPSVKLPQFQPIRSSDVQKLIFKPEENYRPVSDLMKSILLPPPDPPVLGYPLPLKPIDIELLCHLDRIYVRVKRTLFASLDAWKYLKVGNCSVNKVSPEHYFFLYAINSCRVKHNDDEDRVLYTNTLTYEPVNDEPVIREWGFSVPLECHYNKHFRTYSVGYHPQVEAGTVFLRLQTKVSLTPVDGDLCPPWPASSIKSFIVTSTEEVFFWHEFVENWEPIGPLHQYTVGQPVYFIAKTSYVQDGKRLYLSKCYVTACHELDSTLKYTVVDNYGCMVDSKKTLQSKFYRSDEETTLKFSVGALLFKDMVSQPAASMELFIHCEMSLGSETPTSSTKSCFYNADTQEWSELYGNDSVCACCNASCPGPELQGVVKMKISSDSWKIEKSLINQPAAKSYDLDDDDDDYVDDDLDNGGLEMFWDSLDANSFP